MEERRAKAWGRTSTPLYFHTNVWHTRFGSPVIESWDPLDSLKTCPVEGIYLKGCWEVERKWLPCEGSMNLAIKWDREKQTLARLRKPILSYQLKTVEIFLFLWCSSQYFHLGSQKMPLSSRGTRRVKKT